MQKIIQIRGELAKKRSAYIEAMTRYYTSDEEDVQALAVDTATHLLTTISDLEITEMEAIRELELAKTVAEKKYTTLATAIHKLINEK